MLNVSSDELMQWAVQNLGGTVNKETAYLVCYGSRPVVDFANPDTEHSNLFEKAFPCLFPFGQGGIESLQHHGVDFLQHVH
ncbi:hypothetical protein JVT61DRAFT_9883 [Boletus reticuloceps]|uniref:Uncharacterized protein n=1 Tax=Boletus reticuloceps TaxID=495285 RepID=A0A8I3A4B9_9AGAM|nr:hypothetical protein JVT61DRAFT_9883 [Boletus reticuloceps]